MKIEEIMLLLGCTEEEAFDVIQKDKEIDKMSVRECESDLSPEQKAVAKQYRQGDRKPTVYRFDKRERKENLTKSGIIAELVRFLSENDMICAENVQILNKERQISFTKGAETYELTLVQKRKPKN